AETLTPNLGLPYYTGSDPPAGMDQQKNLAMKLDGISSLRPPLVTALPGSPVDGQECYFLADAANGIVWHFRYRASSPATEKWEFLGGPALFASFWASFTVPHNSLTTDPNLAIPIPLSGTYLVHRQAVIIPQAAASFYNEGIRNGAATGTQIRGYVPVAAQVTISGQWNEALVAGDTINSAYFQNSGVAGAFGNRVLHATPRRVG
ncbi:MAG TPA: hypothetical protein VKB59_17350, partial [Micromonosporaceae bacterium]|nr:hypothetical protein [Micromonosporaceae bacterium]